MLEERILNLINADIDGELEPAEKEELQAALDSSAEARAMQAELRKLAHLLDSAPEVEPPPGLAQQILQRMSPTSARPTFSLGELFSSFQPAPAGLAFAAGLLMAVGFYELGPQRGVDGDAASMVGTMVSSTPDDRSLIKNDLLFQGVGFSGKISVQAQDGLYVMNFDLESEDRTEVEVGLDGTGLTFGGFAQPAGDADPVFDTVAISGGTLRVVNQGRQQFAVFLRKDGSAQAVNAEWITVGVSSERDQP
jgi:hypothetical protein